MNKFVYVLRRGARGWTPSQTPSLPYTKVERIRVGWLNGRGDARAEDAQGTPTQSHVSASILVYGA